MGKLKFDGADIVLQEIPGEVTLALNITECPHHCVGCHSEYLANSCGDYVDEQLPLLMKKYGDLITCVCFMGGDQHIDDLVWQCEYLKAAWPNIKMAIYTGSDDWADLSPVIRMMDYVKLGHYDDELGPLTSRTTNQRMYRRTLDGLFVDITHQFWERRR